MSTGAPVLTALFMVALDRNGGEHAILPAPRRWAISVAENLFWFFGHP